MVCMGAPAVLPNVLKLQQFDVHGMLCSALVALADSMPPIFNYTSSYEQWTYTGCNIPIMFKEQCSPDTMCMHAAPINFYYSESGTDLHICDGL